MRFDRMFEDLEHRFTHLEEQQLRAQTEELLRAERAEILLQDRIRAACGESARFTLRDGAVEAGCILEVGADWCAIGDPGGRVRCLVLTGAVAMVEGLTARARERSAGAIGEPSLRAAVRALARDRALVRVRAAGSVMTGRIMHVGADALDLRRAPSGELSDRGSRGSLTVALAALDAIELL